MPNDIFNKKVQLGDMVDNPYQTVSEAQKDTITSIPSNEVYGFSKISETYEEPKKQEQNLSEFNKKLYSILNPLTSTLLNVGNQFANAVKSGELKQVIENTKEKAIQSNINGRKGNLLQNETKNLQDIDFVKNYEYIRTAATDAYANGDMDTYDQLSKQLRENAYEYDQIIKSNPELTSLYYRVNSTKADVDKYGKPISGKSSRIDYTKLSQYDRLKASFSNLLSFNFSEEDELRGFQQKGYGEAVEWQPTAINKDNDRSTIIQKLKDLQYKNDSASRVKQQDIADRQQVLRSGSWYFNPEVIDPKFRQKVDQNKFEFLEPESWLYAVPQAGTSIGEIQTTIGTATLGAMARMTAGALAKKGIPYAGAAIAVGEAALNMGSTYYQRTLETNQEVLDAYNQKVLSLVESNKINFESILNEGKEGLSARGIDTEGSSEVDILNDMLLYGVKTSDEDFEKIKRGAYKGLQDLTQSNQALGLSDLAEIGIYSYGGKLAGKSIKGLAKGAMKDSSAGRALQKGANLIDKRINSAVYKIAKKDPYKANYVRNRLDEVISFGAKMGFTAVSETTEEGIQYLAQQEYLNSAGKDTQTPLLSAFFKNFDYGAEANLALMGLHPDDALNNNEELIQSMKVGGFIGLLLGGTATTIADSRDAYDQIQTDKLTRKMSAYDIANKENDVKVDRWYEAIKKNRYDKVAENLEQIRDNFLPEGLTKEDLNDDIEQAKWINYIYNNKQVDQNLDMLNIKRNTEIHKNFTKAALKAFNNERLYNQELKTASDELSNVLSGISKDDSVVSHINSVLEVLGGYDSELEEDYKVGEGKFDRFADTLTNLPNITSAIIQNRLYTNGLNSLKNELKERSTFINKAKEKGLDLDDSNIKTILDDITRTLNKLKKEKDSFKKYQFVESVPNPINQQEIEQSFANHAILSALYKKAKNKRQVYQNGFITSADRDLKLDFDINTWSNLTEEEKTKILDEETQNAVQENREPLSKQQIISRYNEEQLSKYKVDDEQVMSSRLYANKIIENDLKQYNKNKESYEQDEDLNQPIDQGDGQDILNEGLTQEIEESPVKDQQKLTQDVQEDYTPKGEQVGGSQIGETTPIAIVDTDTKDDLYSAPEEIEKPTKRTVLEEEESPFDFEITADDVSSGEAEDTDIQKPQEKTSDKDKETGEDKVSSDETTEEDKNPIEDKTEQKLDVLTSDMFQDIPEDLPMPRYDDYTKDDVYPEEMVASDALRQLEDEATSVEELTSLDPETYGRKSKEDKVNSRLFIDKNGNIFLDGVKITKEQLEQENLAEAFISQYGKTPAQLLNDLTQSGTRVSGIQSTETIRQNWLVGRTLFYRPDATKPMTLPFEIEGMKTLKSGSELSEAIGDPSFMKNAKVYMAIAPSLDKENKFDPDDATTYSNAAVYMIVNKDGDVYVSAYRSNRSAYLDYRRRLTDEELKPGSRANIDLDVLRESKETIVRQYLSKVDKDANGKYIMPTVALTHVKPTKVSLSNGVFNNIKSGGKPVFRKLNETKTFGIPSNPKNLLKEVTFGYGTGVNSLDPFIIKKLGTDDRMMSDTGNSFKGYSGRIYIFPKPENTPRGSSTVPIMLSEKFFRTEKVKAPIDVVLKSENDGKYACLAEYIYDLMVDGDPYNMLPLILNQGSGTRLSSKDELSAQFLAKKQIGYDPDTDMFYIAIKDSQRNNAYIRKDIPLREIRQNKNLKKSILFNIMQNYHWNTDKDVMTNPLPEKLRNLMLTTKVPKLVLFPGEIEFDLEDLGITEKDGVRTKDKEAPSVLSWMIKSGKLMTDLGDNAFKSGFMFVEGTTVDDSVNPAKRPENRKQVSEKPVDKKATKVSEKIQIQENVKTLEKEEQTKAEETKPKRVLSSEKRAKGLRQILSLGDPTSRKEKKNRYMTDDEIKQYCSEHDMKVAIGNLAYFYNEDGEVKILSQGLLDNMLKSVRNGAKSTEINEIDGKRVNADKAKQWLIKKLGLDPMQVIVTSAAMKSVSNGSSVYGVTRLSINSLGQIIFSKTAAEGIEFHEAWHYVNLLVHNDRQRQQVYEDYIKNNPKYATATKEEVEEALAEDFRKWAIIENSKDLRYLVLKAFKHISNFVKSMFNISQAKYNTVFRNINRGFYSEFALSQQSIQQFNEKYKEGAYFSIPGVSKDRLRNMPTITNPDVFYDVVDSLTSTLLSVFNVRQASDVTKLSENLKYLKDIIQSNLEYGMVDPNNEELVQDVLDNMDIFMDSVVDQLAALNIKANEIRVEESDEKVGYDTGEKDPAERWDSVSFEFSKKLNMSFNAKLFFYSIPNTEYVFTTNENGEKIKELQNIKDPIFGMDTTVPFDIAWNKIMENLWDIDTWEDLISKCEQKKKLDPFFNSLLQYLTGNNAPDENTETQILTTIKSAKNEFSTIQFKEVDKDKGSTITTEEGITVTKRDRSKAGGSWEILDSSNLRLIKKYPRQWGKLFYTSGMIDKSNVRDFKIDEDLLDELDINFKLLREDAQNLARPFLSKREDEKLSDDELQTSVLDLISRLSNILNSVGIAVDDKTIQYLLYGIDSDNTKLPTAYQFDKLYTLLVNSKKGSLYATVVGNLKQIQRNPDGKLTLTNPFPAYKNNFISQLAVAHGKSHPNPSEFSMTGPNNTTIYPITQNNYMSDRLRWLNKDVNESTNALAATYNRSSLLLNASKNGTKLKLKTFIAVKNEATGQSRDYFDISPIEDYLSKMTFMHNDNLISPTMADKKTWHAIEGITLQHDVLSRSRFVEQIGESGQIERVNQLDDIMHFSDESLEVMYNYLLDELNTVEEYYNNISEVEKNTNLRIDNYHGKIKNGKMDNTGNGGYFRYFSSIKVKNENGEYKYVPLNQLLYAWSSRDLQFGTTTALQNITAIKERVLNDKRFALDAINATLQDRVEEELDFLRKKNVIAKSGDTYKNILLPSNILKEYKDKSKKLEKEDSSRNNESALIYSVVANNVLNSIISINEIEKTFVGDPAYYKYKRQSGDKSIIVEKSVDKTKRLGSVLSTGDNLRIVDGGKFTVMHMADNNVKSNAYDTYYNMFLSTEVMKHLQKNNPNIDQESLLNMVNSENIKNTLKTIKKDARESIEKSVLRQIAAYGVNKQGEGNINQADAAVYIRPDFYKRILKSLGEFSPEVEKAFDLMESDQDWLSDPVLYQQSLQTLIKPLKMVYFGNHDLSKLGLSVPVFDKMAIFPMFKVLCKADNSHLYQRMNNSELGNIDMLCFESAVKVGGRNKFQPYLDAENKQFNIEALNKPSTSTVIDGVVNEIPQVGNQNLQTYVQDMKNLRLQMNTDPHEHTDRSLGTQFAKTALSNLEKKRMYGKNKGKNVSGQSIIANVFAAINNLSDLGKNKIVSEFFDAETGNVSETKLSEYLTKSAKQSGLSRDAVQSFTLDQNGRIQVPLSAQGNRRFIESRSISTINKSVVDINTPGGSAIQMSAFGFKRTSAVKQEEVSDVFNDGKVLNALNSDGSMDCMLSVNFFRHVVPSDIKDYTSMRNWLIEKKIIGKDAKPFALGYRIPTQGLSSTCSLKVADILPANMGDTIVVPDDFTAMTGSDFDIDKLYIMSGYYDKDGNYLECDWENKENNTEEHWVNGLLDMYRLAISDDSNIDQARAPLDNLTGKLKGEILAKVMGTSKEEVKPFQEITPSYQLFKKFEYCSGKSGIAPFALNATNHALTQCLNLRMQFGEVGKLYNLGNFDDIYGQDGERILDWLSTMINAHVDVAKDPYIINLNVNQVTYNMTDLLLRTGKGELTFYFLSQPILKDMANTIAELNGEYGVNKDIDSRPFELLNELMNSYSKQLKAYAKDRLPKDRYDKMIKFVDGIFNDEETSNLQDAFDKTKLIKSLDSNRNEDRDINFYIQQLLVGKAYQKLHPYSEKMAKMVRLSQIDTKKYGNMLSQILNFKQQVLSFIEDERDSFYTINEDGTVDEDMALDKYFKTSFLMKKLDNASDLSRKILKTQAITATDAYANIFDYVVKTLTGKKDSSISKDAAVQFDTAIDSFIRGRIASTVPELSMEDGDLSEMVRGDFSIPKRLHNFKINLYKNKDGKYDDFVDANGTITNQFINYIIPIISTSDDIKEMDIIQTQTSAITNSHNMENRLLSYFSELMESNNETIREFALDLAKYAFYTTYDNKNPNSFSHLLSGEYRKSIGYVDKIRYTIDSMNELNPDLQVFTDESDNSALNSYPSISIAIARNNVGTEGFVKEVQVPKFSTVNSRSQYNIPGGDRSYLKAFLEKHRSSNDNFVKVNYKSKNKDNYVLYARVGKIVTTNKVDGKKYPQVTKSVYVAIPKLGCTSGLNNVKEYFKNNNKLSDFYENNIEYFTANEILEEFNDNERVRNSVKNVAMKDLEIQFLPNELFNNNLNNYENSTFSTIENEQSDNAYNNITLTQDNNTIGGGEPIEIQYIDDADKIMQQRNTTDNIKISTDNAVINSYSGNIVPSNDVIFVFGSNPEGRHGAGAAKVAIHQFGAIYGQGEGLQGNAYALPTKDLRVRKNKGYRSISKEQITNNIRKMYEVAKQNPNKKFMIAYRNAVNEMSLNGYTGGEMIDMFIEAGNIPLNVFFSEEWVKSGKFDSKIESKQKQITQRAKHDIDSQVAAESGLLSNNNLMRRVSSQIDATQAFSEAITPDYVPKASENDFQLSFEDFDVDEQFSDQAAKICKKLIID